jgi:hypothetical protein
MVPVGSNDDTNPPASAPGPLAVACNGGSAGSPPARRLRRLTPAQYANTIAVLLKGRATAAKPVVETVPGVIAPLESVAELYRYSTDSGNHSVTDFELRRSLLVTDDLARRLLETLRAGSCLAVNGAGSGRAACVETLIKDKGAILFRRPLAADEVTQYARIAAAVTPTLTADDSLALAFRAMLLAPQFVFQAEIGEPHPTIPGARRLTSYEVASAIAYGLTDAPADAELWDAATKNALLSSEQVGAHVTRIVAGRAATALREFPLQQFQLGRVMQVSKAMEKPCVFGREQILKDVKMLIDDVVTNNGRGDFLKTLLTTGTVYSGCDSYQVYGTMRPADDKATVKGTAPAGQRSGLLTHPAFLVGFSAFDESLPVRRGHFVNETLLCRKIPDVPIGVIPQLPARTANQTSRERLALHSKDPSCGACHSMMDPIGLAFESYEHWGKYRTMEAGRPVDASGVLSGTADLDGPFKSIADLSTKMASSPAVEGCFVRQGFRFFMGRNESAYDACTLAAAVKSYSRGGDYLSMVTTLFSSPSFFDRSN